MANRRFIDFPIASTVNDNDIVLIWQDGLNKQATKGTLIQGAPTSLEGLTDVDIAGLINGQILQYNSTTGKWENVDRTDINLSQLGDVSIVSPTNGQVLVYNSTTSKWENSSGGYVPYVGAVTTVDLGAQGLLAGYIGLDTSVVSVPNDQGLIYWDDSKSTAALIMNGTTQHIGQDTYFYVKNSSGSNIAKGVAVRFDGTDGASGHLLIAPFLADGTYPSAYFMGVTAEAIDNGGFGQVTNFGEIEGIDTSIYSAGDLLYASTTSAGAFQTTAPVAPNNIVLIAAAVNSKNNGAIIVRPTYGSNINDDEGVKIVSPTTGDLLQLQAGGLWENKTKAQVLGGTSSQFVKGDGSLDSNTYGTGTVTSVGLASATSGVTIGSTPVTTSGTITIAIATASGSQNGLLSSTDWTTFNNKQNALTNPVTGTGTTNYLPKFTGTSTIGNSVVQEVSGNLGLGVTPSAANLPTYENQYGFFSGQSEVNLTTNAYFNSGFKFIGGSNFALRYHQSGFNGSHQWLVATGGTAGNAISFTQAMTLFSDGNLLLTNGTVTNAGFKLDVIGTGRFNNSTNAATLSILNNNGYPAIIDLSTTTVTSTARNWAIFANGTNWGDLEFKVSSANGGNPYTTGSVALRLSSTGAATFSSSVTANQFNAVNDRNYFSRSQIRLTSTSNNASTLDISVSDTTTNIFSNYFGGGNDNRIVIGTYANLSNQLVLATSGNVLIGTTTDSGYKLDVNGTGRFSSSVTATGDIRSNAIFRDHQGEALMQTSGSDTQIGSFGAGTPRTTSLIAGNDRRLFITSGGNVLIGTTTDAGYKLDVAGTGAFGLVGNVIFTKSNGSSYSRFLYSGSNLNVVFTGGTTANSGAFGVNNYEDSVRLFNILNSGAATFSSLGTGTVYSNGGTLTNTNPSDYNLKTNIENLAYGLDEILKLNPVSFHWKNDTINQGKQFGFIAQEVQKIMPDLVKQGDYLGLDKEAIFTTLVNAIKELKQEIDTLKN